MSQPYELFMFARKHRLPVSQARAIIARHGADRAEADAAARAYRGERRSHEAWPAGEGADIGTRS
jgi:hypothetical protein